MHFIKITGISSLVTEDNLRELFQCCGKILKLTMSHTDCGNGCIIQFSNEDEADTAQMISNTELGDSKLIVKQISDEEGTKLTSNTLIGKKTAKNEYEEALNKMKEMMQGPGQKKGTVADEVRRTIYIGNLNRAVTGEQLRTLFETVGDVLFIKFSGTAQFRYAFVEFGNEESAKSAFALHGTFLGGQSIKVGQAHNPIFKDDMSMSGDANLKAAKKQIELLTKKTVKNKNHSKNKQQKSRDRQRKRRINEEKADRKRKKHNRGRKGIKESKKKIDTYENSESGVFWDGFQWHTNKDTINLETHVTSIIQDNQALQPDYTIIINSEQQMKDEAEKALAVLKITKNF